MSHPARIEGRRAVYLRPDAITRLFAPSGVPNLTKQQQAALLGVPDSTYFRLTVGGQRATDLLIADILDAAKRLAAQYKSDPLGFYDLFEIRDVGAKPSPSKVPTAA